MSGIRLWPAARILAFPELLQQGKRLIGVARPVILKACGFQSLSRCRYRKVCTALRLVLDTIDLCAHRPFTSNHRSKARARLRNHLSLTPQAPAKDCL